LLAIEKVDEMGKTIPSRKATVIMGGKIQRRSNVYLRDHRQDEDHLGWKGLPFAELKQDMQVAVDYTKEAVRPLQGSGRLLLKRCPRKRNQQRRPRSNLPSYAESHVCVL
jgi:hypothetical protein